MKYDPTTRTITLGRKDCTQCSIGEPGRVPTRLDCLTCGGTGNGPRGGKGRCRKCFGFGNRYEQAVTETCPRCEGNFEGREEENYCDTAPLEAIQDMPIKVVLIDRDSTWNEQYLGMGAIWSTTDYGREYDKALFAARSDDKEERRIALDEWKQDLIEHVSEKLQGERVQAVKIVRSRDDLTIKDIILIKVTRGGYTVSAFDLQKEN